MLEKDMGDDFVERRAHPRIPISVRVRVQYTGQEFSAQSVNISAGGVFLDSERRLPVGTRVHLVFTVPIYVPPKGEPPVPGGRKPPPKKK